MRNVFSLAVIAALLGIDQWTKYIALVHLKPVGSMEFIPGLLGWTYVENTGMAFGLFKDNLPLLSVLTGLALLALLYLIYFYKPLGGFARGCLVAIFSGGAGNLIDRVFRGFVVDFAEFQFMNFAIFNFADVLVTCGVFVLALHVLWQELRQWRKKQKASSGNGSDG